MEDDIERVRQAVAKQQAVPVPVGRESSSSTLVPGSLDA